MDLEKIERCVLAVDAGGTKCEAMLVSDDGEILGRGLCEHTDAGSGRNVHAGSGRSEESINAAIEGAVRNYSFGELHIAGIIPDDIPPAIRAERIGKLIYRGVGEEAAGFALAGVDVGVVMVVGTGTLVFGRTRDGREMGLDCMGPLVGDFGSGYQIGFQAIRAAAKSSWHARRATSLKEVVYQHTLGTQVETREKNLVRFMFDIKDRSEIAALARLVNQEADAGDAIAISIIESAAADVAETVHDLVDNLEMTSEPYVMVATGSVVTRSKIYWRRLCELVKQFAPKLEPVLTSAPPVVGRALVPLREIAPENIESIRKKLIQATTQSVQE